jgi:hypothetical protein
LKCFNNANNLNSCQKTLYKNQCNIECFSEFNPVKSLENNARKFNACDINDSVSSSKASFVLESVNNSPLGHAHVVLGEPDV